MRKLSRTFPRVIGNVACIVLGLLILAACSRPEFGQSDAVPENFEVTPYAPEPSGDAPLVPVVVTVTAESAATSAQAVGGAAGDESQPVSLEASAPVNPQTGQRQYNGEIVARERVDIVAETGGMALVVNLEVSDLVSAGDVLVKLDSSTQEAGRAQALAALDAAQAQLDLLLEETAEEDLEAARAAVSAAAAAYRRALEGPTEEDQRLALAQLRQAEAAVTVAQAAYNEVKGNPMIGAMPQSLQLQQATLQVEAAQAQYDKVLKGSTADIIAGAYAQLAQARAQLARLEEGAKDAQIGAAEAQVRQAETALYLAQLQVDNTVITAPVDGIVSDVMTSVGSMVAPGAPIASLRSSEVEIVIPVEEYRLSQLRLGLPAVLLVDAYPGDVFEGEIVRIAPELNPATRTVDVTIRPVDPDYRLAPGMFTTVELVQ